MLKLKNVLIWMMQASNQNKNRKNNRSFYLADGAAYKWKQHATTFVLYNMGMLYICTFAYVTCVTVATLAITNGCCMIVFYTNVCKIVLRTIVIYTTVYNCTSLRHCTRLCINSNVLTAFAVIRIWYSYTTTMCMCV